MATLDSPDVHAQSTRTCLSWYELVGQQVGVWHPADIVGERLVTAGEVSWTPAVDGSTHILCGTYQYRKHDQKRHREAMM